MGRKLTAIDFGGDLHQLLAHCLKLADESGFNLTAAYIATARDAHDKEAVQRSTSGTGGVAAKSKPDRSTRTL